MWIFAAQWVWSSRTKTQRSSSFSICRGYSLQRESHVASVSFSAHLSTTGGWVLLPHGEPRFEYLGQSWHGCPGKKEIETHTLASHCFWSVFSFWSADFISFQQVSALVSCQLSKATQSWTSRWIGHNLDRKLFPSSTGKKLNREIGKTTWQ